MSELELTTPQKRIGYLDAIKALGIILVIRGHVQLYGLGVETYDTLASIMFYSFNMPIFFFVSGYLTCSGRWGNSASGVTVNLFRKFLFLVIPAILFTFAYYLLEHMGPNDFIEMGFGRYWFTITLWQCFFIYGIVCIITDKKVIQVIILILLLLIGLVCLSMFGSFGPTLLDMNHLTKYFPFFAIGIISRGYNGIYEITTRNQITITICTISFFSILFVLHYSIPSIVVHLLRDIFLRYIGTFIVISWFVCHADWFNKNNRINRVLMDIGKKSLGIYMLQYFFIPDLTVLSIDWHNIDSFTQNIIAFSYSFIITLVCYIFISVLSNSSILRKYALGRK